MSTGAWQIRRWERPYALHGADTAVGVPRPPPRMGAFGLNPETDVGGTVFEGCANRVRVAAYLGALSLESRVQGFAVGAIAGLLGGAALLVYLERGKR